MRGKFITLEGGEGGGKTTNLRFIADYLRGQGIDVLVTHEPGGTPFAERIRDLVLTPDVEEPIAPDTELLLFFASRAQHIAEKIKPALARGQWVVCSRFTDSSFAYQMAGRGVSAEHIEGLAQWVQDDFWPDLTLILDLPVEVGMQRAQKRAALDRIEQEEKAFFERVRQNFLTRSRQHARYRVIDANQPLLNVQQTIVECLNLFIGATL